MKIIRTAAVELSSIPAIAFKQKLTSGGAGINILRFDSDEHAIGTIDKRTGEILPFGKVDEKLFPTKAFDEAFDLTVGLPYSGRGNIKIATRNEKSKEPEEEVSAEIHDKDSVTESDEYKAIVTKYSNENGKLNYDLLNKDFIQFASGSSIVANMVKEKMLTDEILNYIVKSRAALIAEKKEPLSDLEVERLIETLDEINPKSAFKDLKAFINKLLAEGKRK